MRQLQALSRDLPRLQQFAESRASWLRQNTEETSATQTIAELKSRLEHIQPELTKRASQIENLDANAQKLEGEKTRTQLLSEQLEQQIVRFQEVDGGTSCHYCGQPLTEEHLASERERLENEILLAKTTLRENTARHQAELDKLQQSKVAHQKLLDDKTSLEEKIHAQEQICKTAQSLKRSAEGQMEVSVRSLSDAYRRKIVDGDNANNTTWSMTIFPSTTELQEIQKNVNNLAKYEALLDERVHQKTQLDSLLAQRKYPLEELERLEQCYPENIRLEIRRSRDDAEEAEENLKQCLAELENNLRNAEADLENLRIKIENTKRQHQSAEREIKENELLQAGISRNTNTLSEELLSKWGLSLDACNQRFLTRLREEKMQLAGADEKLVRLIEARQKIESSQTQLVQIRTSLKGIPEQARRPVSELETQESELSKQRGQLEQELQMLKSEKTRLEDRKKQIEKLEAQRLEATKQANLYQELTTLLGREYLQRYLLMQVESNLLEYANEALDSISEGTLRLELREQADTGKALDIVAYNQLIGESPKPTPISYLSGSQRFRVAVSLALGIGRFASQSDNRIESVIIDEGFGGLDKEGRDAIIDELHNLKNSLGRIILVSHQEEFATAFSNGYKIYLEDGTSRNTLLTN